MSRRWSLGWNVSTGASLLGLALVVFGTTWASMQVIDHVGRVIAVWPTNAIVLGVLLRADPSNRPAFVVVGLAGALAAVLVAGDAAPVALVLAACNMLEVALCAILLHRQSGVLPPEFSHIRSLAVFSVLTALPAPAISAALGAALMAVSKGMPFLPVWRVWFVGDALGMIIVLPLLLVVRWADLFRSLRRKEALRAAVVVLVASAAAMLAFAQNRYPLASLVFPALVLAAFTSGYSGTAAAVFLVALISNGLTVAGSGPFMRVDPASAFDRIIYLQIYLAAAALVALPAASALAGRSRLERALRTSEGRLQQALRTTEIRLDDALTSMADGLAVYDAKEQLVFCNPRYRQMHPLISAQLVPGVDFGTALRLAVQLGQFRGVDPGNRAQVEELIAAKRAGGTFEVELVDGRWVQTITRRTADGGIVNVRRDVSGYKRAEANLRESEERYRALVDTSPDAVLVHQAGMVILANRQAATLLGAAKAEDLEGRPIRSFISQASLSFAEARTAQLKAPGDRLEPAELTYCRCDGTPVLVEASAAAVLIDGYLAIQVVFRDITERKRLEKVIESRNCRLEAMNAELDQFASMAAHDLRAPLRQIGVLCDWLVKELGAVCTDKAHEHFDQIRRRVRRMGGLIEGLRQYAHAGGRDLPPGEVSLSRLAAEAVELAAPPEGFTVEVGPDLPAVTGPEAALALILRNLIGNAVKHHDRPDGRLRVAVEERADELELVVEDDGPGIPAELRERAFDLFARFRGDAAEPGGVGLALVRRTLAVHGGRIWIAPSSLGRGTAIHATWPKRQAVAA